MDEADNEADHSNLDSFSNVHFKSTRLTGQEKAPATVNKGFQQLTCRSWT